MWPFSRKAKSPQILRDDVFWLSDAARADGLVRAARDHLVSGTHVMLVTHNSSAVSLLMDAAIRAGVPLDAVDVDVTPAQVRTRLVAQPSPVVMLALSGSLRPATPSTQPGSPTSVALLIAGRFPLRTRDDIVVAFAQGLNAQCATFHLSTEDTLLSAFRSGQTKQILLSLGMTETESITHPMLSRSIRRAQEKVAKKCPDQANVEQWLRTQNV